MLGFGALVCIKQVMGLLSDRFDLRISHSQLGYDKHARAEAKYGDVLL